MATPLLSPAAAPPAAPQRGGLLAAAVPGTGDWLRGVITWPESGLGWQLSQDCSPDTVEHGDTDGALRPLAAVPYLIRTWVPCPHGDIPAMSIRVLERLEALTGQAMARELLTGDLTRSDPYQLPAYEWLNPEPTADHWTNPYLTHAGGEVLPDQPHPLAALGMVEAEVGQRIPSGPITLHAPAQLVMEAADGLERRGELLYTITGALVVPDYGYGTGDTVYGTGPFTAWVGPKVVDDDPREVVSRTDNRIKVYAERPAMALFDPQTLVSCQVTP